jgi:hypothetical protein
LKYEKGSIISVFSPGGNKTTDVLLKHEIPIGDSITVPDPYRSILAMQVNQRWYYGFDNQLNCDDPDYPAYGISRGGSNPTKWKKGVSIVHNPLGPDSTKLHIHLRIGNVERIKISNDGKTLFYSNGYSIRKIDRFDTLRTLKEGENASANWTFYTSGTVTNILGHPHRKHEYFITVGESNPNVFHFVYVGAGNIQPKSIKGNLPTGRYSVNDLIIDIKNSKKAYIATSIGLFKTEDIYSGSVNWERIHLPKFNITSISQQTIPGTEEYESIYIGTEGGGIWSNGIYVGKIEYEWTKTSAQAINNLTVFPNPASRFISLDLSNIPTKGRLQVYNIQGKLVKTWSVVAGSKFENKLDISSFKPGPYFMVLDADGIRKFGKFIKNSE